MKTDKTEEKIQKEKLWPYFRTSLLMLAYQLVFSMISLVFLIDQIPGIVKTIMGFVFLVPVMATVFMLGRKEGERLFKKEAKSSKLGDVHGYDAIRFPWYKSFFHVLLFAAPFLICIILGVALKNLTLRGIVFVCFFPVSLIFTGIGAIKSDVVNAWSLAVYIPAILLTVAAFIVGYVLTFISLKRRQGEIKSELRSFEN